MSLRRVAKRTLTNARWCLRGGPLLTLFDDNFPGSFDRLQCIFVHIPKTAGSSVALSLFGHQIGHRRYVDYWRENRRKTRDYFKFTFVRNPWDRFVSAYHFLRAGGMNSHDHAWADRNLTPFRRFEDFVKGWLNEDNIRRSTHFQLQYTYLAGYGSSDIKVNFVGRVEHFDRDLRTIGNRLGVQCESLRTNQSPHKDYRYYYTDETADIVRRVYERDILRFGYEFDGASTGALVENPDRNEKQELTIKKDKSNGCEAA